MVGFLWVYCWLLCLNSNAELQRENEVLRKEVEDYKKWANPSPWQMAFSEPAEKSNLASGGRTNNTGIREEDSSTMLGDGVRKKTPSTTGASVRFAQSPSFQPSSTFLPTSTLPPTSNLQTAAATPIPPSMPRFESAYYGANVGASPTTATRNGASGMGPSDSFIRRLTGDERQNVVPRNLRNTNYQGQHSRFPSSSNSNMVGHILSNARKVIITKVVASDSVVELLDSLMSLEEEIEDAFPDESEKTKILVALRNMEGTVCNDGKAVLRSFKTQEVFDFGLFIVKVFKFSYPAPKSALGIAFSELKQGQKTIVAYARQFKAIIRLLEYDISGYMSKFISGLAESKVSDALNCQPWENLEFDDLVGMAVSISNNLRGAKRVGDRNDRAFVIMGGGRAQKQSGGDAREESEEEGEDEILKILGTPISKYFDVAKARNAAFRCFQCFSSLHMSNKCVLKRCVFCDKTTNEVRHMSLLCPKCPSDLTKYIQGRDRAKKEKMSEKVGVRFTDDFDNYEYNKYDMSDSE